MKMMSAALARSTTAIMTSALDLAMLALLPIHRSR
jgi:hypothetical protein